MSYGATGRNGLYCIYDDSDPMARIALDSEEVLRRLSERDAIRQRWEAAEKAYAWQVECVRREGGVMMPLEQAIAALAAGEGT